MLLLSPVNNRPTVLKPLSPLVLPQETTNVILSGPLKALIDTIIGLAKRLFYIIQLSNSCDKSKCVLLPRNLGPEFEQLAAAEKPPHT